jgi:hypothetical protein
MKRDSRARDRVTACIDILFSQWRECKFYPERLYALRALTEAYYALAELDEDPGAPGGTPASIRRSPLREALELSREVLRQARELERDARDKGELWERTGRLVEGLHTITASLGSAMVGEACPTQEATT